MRPTRVFGVDFSGAKLAGRTAWVATCDLPPDGNRLIVRDVVSLETFVGNADREHAHAGLVRAVLASSQTLWAMDFPFGLPIELELGTWRQQLDYVADWTDTPQAFGRHCLNDLGGGKHIRRVTDVETKTPFDCYHYRIIFQTFYGMRDVARPLARDAATAVLPFQHARLAKAERVVVEACPSSTLKRLGLPHHVYKQPAGGPLTPPRKANRQAILDGLIEHVDLPPGLRRRCMRDSGGDAIDAVVAAVGGWHGLRTLGTGHTGRPRYAKEGRIYS